MHERCVYAGGRSGHKTWQYSLLVRVEWVLLLFSQKELAYDFEFVHAYLSNNKKIRFSPNKWGGNPPITPQIVIPGWTAGGVHALWVSDHPPRRTHIYLVFIVIIVYLAF